MKLPLLFLSALVLSQGVSPSGLIEGFVVRAGTEPPFPLTNARLELTRGTETFVTRTDSLGRFVFSGLSAGRFRLRVTKDGFIRQEYPRAAMGAPGLPIDLAPGQEWRNIIFGLDSAPTISGMIRDPGNAPLAGVVVQALRRGYDARGNRTLSLVASVRSDDGGRYRLYWLDPGEYFVSAVPSPPPSLGIQARESAALAPTYFPGYPSVDDAQAIRLESGRDAHGMDFRLAQQYLGAVQGFVSSISTGRPVRATVFLAAAEDGKGVARYQVQSVEDTPVRRTNNYSIPAVPPGSYILSAIAGGETAARRILVRPGGLRSDLEVGPGVTIRGRVSLSEPAADLRATRVGLAEIDPALPPPAESGVLEDGSFALAGVQPGYYSVSVSGLPDDLYLKAASLGGADALEKPFPVAYRGPSDFTIQLAADGGRLSGVIFDAGNRVFAGAYLTLVPESENRSRLDRYRAAVSREDGSFVIRGIAPGDYKLFAWANPEANAHFNLEYLGAYESFGTPVRIQPGENTPIAVPVIRMDP